MRMLPDKMEFVMNAFQTHTHKVLVPNEDELGQLIRINDIKQW
jgi:hypothetical protein